MRKSQQTKKHAETWTSGSLAALGTMTHVANRSARCQACTTKPSHPGIGSHPTLLCIGHVRYLRREYASQPNIENHEKARNMQKHGQAANLAAPGASPVATLIRIVLLLNIPCFLVLPPHHFSRGPNTLQNAYPAAGSNPNVPRRTLRPNAGTSCPTSLCTARWAAGARTRAHIDLKAASAVSPNSCAEKEFHHACAPTNTSHRKHISNQQRPRNPAASRKRRIALDASGLRVPSMAPDRATVPQMHACEGKRHSGEYRRLAAQQPECQLLQARAEWATRMAAGRLRSRTSKLTDNRRVRPPVYMHRRCEP